MALYWTDFSDDTLGAAPSGWTLKGWLAGELVVAADAQATNGVVLKLAPTTNARRVALWDLVGTDADTEILVRARTPSFQTGNRGPVILRQQGGTADLKGYTTSIAYNDVVTLGRYNTSSNSLSPTVTVSGLNHYNTANWYYLRYRVNGSSLKFRAWNEGEVEPSTWQLEITDTGLTAAGAVGLFAYYPDGLLHIDYIGVGTAGDTAPNGPQVSAGFTASPLFGPDDLTVAFADTSMGATSWAWQFGDGQTSSQQNPTHVYTAPGTYSVTLTVNGGAASVTRTDYITVADSSLPAVSGDFEGGNVNEGASGAVRVGDDYVITLTPRKQVNNYTSGATWWYFGARIDKMQGKRPQFHVVWTDWIGKAKGVVTQKESWVPCWTATPEDPASWKYAPSWSYTEPNVSFQFTETFDADVVYVTYRPYCTPSMLRTWVDGLSGITNLPGKSNFVMGTAPATVDETGRALPAREILGFMFGSGPAQMVVTSGVHPCEDHGTQVMQGFVETLLADTPSARAFRAKFTVFCYPCVNPQGRAGRDYRGSFDPAGLTIDPARDWTDTPVLSVVQQVRADIAARCAGGRPDIMMDFHGQLQPWYSHSIFGYGTVSTNLTTEQEYYNAVLALQPGLEYNNAGTAIQPTSYFSTKSAGGPAGMFYIVEISDWVPDQYEASMAFGVKLASCIANIEDNVYGRRPIGAVGALTADGTPYGVTLTAGPVANGVEYRFLRDGAEIQGWSLDASCVDASVAAGEPHTYAYQARNPGGQTTASAGVQAARQVQTGRLRYGVTPFGQQPYGVTPWGV